jgi:phenylacetate-CoA oxygenase PaaH subunit
VTEQRNEHAGAGAPGGEATTRAGTATEERHSDSWETPLRVPHDVWAVFLRARTRDPHVYVGDVHAPDAEMALVLAKENYTRRDPCVNLWVVRADQIHATAADAVEMFAPVTDKSYRFGGSYRQQQKAYRSSWRLSQREEDQ